MIPAFLLKNPIASVMGDQMKRLGRKARVRATQIFPATPSLIGTVASAAGSPSKKLRAERLPSAGVGSGSIPRLTVPPQPEHHT